MGLLKFGLCVVISISCVSKIYGDSSRNLVHTELECSEEDGVLQSGPCIQCICVQQKIVCVKVVCGLEDDDDSGSVAGTESIAMYQKVRPPEVFVKLPHSPITNTIYKQPIKEILQEDDYPDEVVAVSIMSSDDDSQEDRLGVPISIQTHIPSDYNKKTNIFDDLLADNTPSDSSFLTETHVEDILKTLLTSINDNNNDKYLMIVPEDFQSNEYEFEKNGRPVAIPFARQPVVFARPGDKRLFMRPRHYMRNDDSPYSNKFKSFKYPRFNKKPVNHVPVKEPDDDYWYDYTQKHPDVDLKSQYKSVGHKWPFTKEKLKGDFKTSKKFKYPWIFNHKPGGINRPANQLDRNYYKFLQQHGDNADLSSYYMKKTPINDFHSTDQSYINHHNHHHNSNADVDRYDRLSNPYDNYEKADNDQTLVLNDKEKKIGNFNISDDQQFIRPTTLGNDQAIYQEFNSSFPKSFESMKQIPISYQLLGQNVKGYPNDAYVNKNQTAMTDQLKWQDANGYSEILSNKQPKPALEFNENDLFGTGNNQQIFNFLQQKNDSSYDSKYTTSNKFSKISQSLQNRPLVSMSAITPGQTQSGSNINNSNEQMLLPNKYQLEQHDNAQFGGLSSKYPENYQYNYKLPANNIIQIFDNKKQVNYSSNDSQYTHKNFSKILFGQQNSPIISISEILPSDIQDAKPENTNSIKNENKEDMVKKIKWLQDHNYLLNNRHHKPVLQSSSIVSTYKLKPGKFDYPSIYSGYYKKHQKLSPDQFLWKYGNKYPSMQDYKDGEPVDDYDEYGVLASINHQMFSNKPKVKNSKYHKQNFPFSHPNSDNFKLSNQQNSTFDQDKNRQPCGPDDNCGYKSWPLGKKIRPIPLSFLLGDLTNLEVPNNEQDSSIKYEDSNGNLFITVPFTNGGIPDFENQDNGLFNQNDTNYIVISYPNIEKNTQIPDNEQPKQKEPWDFTYEDENNANRFPDLWHTTPPSTLFTDLNNNIPAPNYNIPEDKKFEFSQLNSVVPKEPVLLPYLSKSKKHKHNHYPKSHIVNHKPKHPDKDKPFKLQDVIYDKYYNMIPGKNKPYLEKQHFQDKNITPKLIESVPNYEAYPNQLSNYVSEIPKKYKYYQQNVLPVLQDTIPSPNHNTIATLPYANQLIYNKKPVPILEYSNNMNPLKLFTKPNYYPLHPKGLLSKNKGHIILPNKMQILPKVFPKRVIPGQTPRFYLQNGIPKFPEKNLFSSLYEYYYPLLSSFPQVTRNKPEATTVSDILKFIKKMANNNPLKLFLKDFLNDESRMPDNTDDYDTDESNPIFNPRQDVSDYKTNFVSTVPKGLSNYDNNQIHTNDFPGPITKPSEKGNVYIILPEESLSNPLDKNVVLANKHPSKKIINHEHRQPNTVSKFKAENNVDGDTFNYELPSDDYNKEYPLYSDTTDNEYLERYVNNILPDLISPGQTKYKNILSSDDRILPKYNKPNNVGCVVCETFNKNINLLAKYLNKNHQQNDIMYLVLKDIIKPLVQFVQKLISDNNNFFSKISSAKPKPLLLHSKEKTISVSPKFRPFNNKKRKNRYHANNSKEPPFDLNGASDVIFQNDSQILPEKGSIKPRLNQYSSPPKTNNLYNKPDKSQHSTLYNKYHKKPPPKAKKQHAIAREDDSVNSLPDQNLENPQSYQRESHMVEDDENGIPKKTIGKIPQNEKRVSFEDYLDIPIEEEEDSDEYSPYHRPKLHKISSFASDPNRKIYLYQNPNAKFVDGPYLPKKGVNIKLYDKPHDSDEDPVLTDEFNLIPMGIPRPKENSDEGYEIQNDDHNTKSQEFYDRIRVALHNPYEYDNIKPVYNTKIIHTHEEKPVVEHHIVVPTFNSEQVCSLCKTLKCDRHIPNNEQNNLQNPFSNYIQDYDQFELSKITAHPSYTDSNLSNTQLLDSNILSRLVRALIVNIIAESKSYSDHKFQETQWMNMQESSILSDIFSLFEYYQIINNINRPHTIYNLFQNTLPIISSYNEIDTPSQPEYIPFQNDNNPYLESIILNPHIIPDTTSNVVLEILKRINQVNIEVNSQKDLEIEVMANLILEKFKPCSDNFNFETNENSEIIANYLGSKIIPLRTMLSKFKSLYLDLNAKKNHQSEEEPRESVWLKPKTLFNKASYLPQYFNRLQPLLLRKIVTPSSVKRPFSNHIVNYLKNSKGDKIRNVMPIESEKYNIYGRHIKPKTNKKRNFNNIYNVIKHAWEAYLSSNEDQLDYAKFSKPNAKDYFNTNPAKYKDKTDVSLGSDKFPFWQEMAYSDIKPIGGAKKPDQFISKDHTKTYFDYINDFKGHNKYPNAVTNSKQKYNNMPYGPNINEEPGDFLNKWPAHYIEPFKGNKFKDLEPNYKWQKPNKGNFPVPKHNFKPTDKGTKYDNTEVFEDSGKTFKGHKYPAIESLKHAWKISNVLSDQGPSTLPKYLKPRGIKKDPDNISSNNHDLEPNLDNEFFYPWQKQNVLSTEDQYSFPNDLTSKEIQYPDLAPIKNKRNPEMVLSKIRPFNHKFRDPMKNLWQKTIKPSGLSEIPYPKYFKPKEIKYPEPSNKYTKMPDEFYINYPFESDEQTYVEPAKHDWKEPDISPDLSQFFLTENLNPTTEEINYPDIKQVSGEFYSKNPFEHHGHLNIHPGKLTSPDLSSDNLEPNSKEIQYTTLEPTKYTDLLNEITNYAPFKSHEETDVKPSKHILQSPDTSFAKGQLPYTKYLKPQDSVNEYSNEEAIKSNEETGDIFYNQDHALNQNSDYANHFKGRKLADLETEDNSWETPEISPDQDNMYQSKYLNSERVDWTAADSNENFWQKSDVANDNDDLNHSEPRGSEINLNKRENPEDHNSDLAAILDYIHQKPELTETDQKDYNEPIFEIDSKGRNARWVDVTNFNVQRGSPNAVRHEYAEAPLIEDDSDLT